MTTPLPNVIYTKATAELAKSVEEDLKVEDPTPEQAIAMLKAFEEEIRKDCIDGEKACRCSDLRA